jgi:hypothetical protein
MRYDAEATVVAGEHYATLQSAMPADEALALRHARAMRAVLLAAKAWAKAPESDEFRYADAERRLYAAQIRLAKTENMINDGGEPPVSRAALADMARAALGEP